MLEDFNYIKEQFYLHKKFFLWAINKLTKSKNISISLKAANFKFFLKRLKLKISFDREKGLYSINDKQRLHYFGDLTRGLNIYYAGLDYRAKDLYESYFLNKINFKREDIVIDCGANYADLWLSLKGKINNSNYITFEPSILEYASIKENAPHGKHYNLGLSNKIGISTLYVNEKDADSSLCENSCYTHKLDVKTTTLSEFVRKERIEKIKLFKLEAEGFEPEILEGAEEILQKIEFIAIDGGYERGKNQEETFSKLCNILISKKFTLKYINFIWGRALLRNSLIK